MRGEPRKMAPTRIVGASLLIVGEGRRLVAGFRIPP